MPALQISFVPWGYDSAVVDHALSLTRLHEEHAPTILALAKQATEDGSPINRPVWWIDPTDQEALGAEDQFLLGNDILVAPVLEEGAVARSGTSSYLAPPSASTASSPQGHLPARGSVEGRGGQGVAGTGLAQRLPSTALHPALLYPPTHLRSHVVFILWQNCGN